jgi:hypothetical protein
MTQQSGSTRVRQKIITDLWYGRGPFPGFPVNLYQNDYQGWGSSAHRADANARRVENEAGVHELVERFGFRVVRLSEHDILSQS